MSNSALLPWLGSGDASLAAFRGQTLVLGFARSWHDARPSTLPRLRAELRGLGAALLLISPHEVYVFRADDELEIQLETTTEQRLALARSMREHGVDLETLGADATSLVVLDGDGRTRWSRARLVLESPLDALLAAISLAGTELQRREPASVLSLSRRELIVVSLAAAFALSFVHGCTKPTEHRTAPAPAPPPKHERDVTLKINGEVRTLKLEPRVSLLDALRERLGLTGTKKGCDHGQCGACTVLVGGQRVNACLLLAVMAEGADITTIEGLAQGETLHPMQAAFVVEDGLQCGYCTPGQIVSAVALLKENRATTDAEIREQMSGNICRCGAYPNIVRAIQRARTGSPT